MATLAAEPLVMPFVFKSGEVISSSQMNANFEQVVDAITTLQIDVEGLVAGGDSLWVATPTDYYVLNKEVGIGTSAPSSLLHLYSNTGDAGITSGETGLTGQIQVKDSSGTTRVLLNGSGKSYIAPTGGGNI